MTILLGVEHVFNWRVLEKTCFNLMCCECCEHCSCEAPLVFGVQIFENPNRISVSRAIRLVNWIFKTCQIGAGGKMGKIGTMTCFATLFLVPWRFVYSLGGCISVLHLVVIIVMAVLWCGSFVMVFSTAYWEGYKLMLLETVQTDMFFTSLVLC